MTIKYEYYKVFYFVAKYQNITLAAETLFLTQPAVSKCIRNLENEIGCTLFIRSKRGVKLTEEGKTLFEHIAKAYEHITVGEKKVKELINVNEGAIRIGASEVTLHFYLLPYLERFHQFYPKVKIHILNLSTPQALEALKNGKIDFAVVTSPIEENTYLESHSVGVIQDIFVAGKQFEKLKGRVVPLQEVMEEPIICLTQQTGTRKYLNDFFAANGIVLEADIELATMDLVMPFIERNLGIGIVVESFAKNALVSQKVFKVQTDKKIPPREICIVTAKQNAISLASQKFLELLK